MCVILSFFAYFSDILMLWRSQHPRWRITVVNPAWHKTSMRDVINRNLGGSEGCRYGWNFWWPWYGCALDFPQLIATLFGIGVSTFRVTVFTWVNALYTIFVPKLVQWPWKDTVKHYLPQFFRKDFPDVCVIIDAHSTKRTAATCRGTPSSY